LRPSPSLKVSKSGKHRLDVAQPALRSPVNPTEFGANIIERHPGVSARHHQRKFENLFGFHARYPAARG